MIFMLRVNLHDKLAASNACYQTSNGGLFPHYTFHTYMVRTIQNYFVDLYANLHMSLTSKQDLPDSLRCFFYLILCL